MPGIRDASSADRALGQRINMHPRRGGDLFLAPDDILEGIGNFLEYDADGNPVGWRLGQVEVPDGRHVYVGRTPDTTIRVTPRPLDYDRPSHLVNYELPEIGHPAPKPGTPGLAKIPRPPAPTLRALTAQVEGYKASSAAKPHWYAIAYVKNGNLLTGYGPPVAFQLEFGQSVNVPLPQLSSLPEGIFQVALLMADPDSSSAAGPGPMSVQRIVDLRYHNLPYYELTGPLRSDGLPASRTNKTTLPTPPSPDISRDHSNYGSRCAHYTAKVVWTDDAGETLEGASSSSVTIGKSTRYTILATEETLVYKPGAGYVPADKNTVAFLAGEGRITVTRPPAPVGATGWKVLLYISPIFDDQDFSAGWRWVTSRLSQKGDALPFPLWQQSVSTAGWEGSEEYYAKNDTYVCVDASLPTANTTGVPAPEDELPTPEATSASRPSPGDLFVRVTDTVRGRESLPSPARKIQIESDTIASIIFVDPSNRLANPAFVETDPNGDPLYWTISRTGGLARVEASPTDTDGQQLVIETDQPRTTATPFASTDAKDLDDNTTPDFLDLSFDVEPPISGTPSGTFNVTLTQEKSDGTTEDTVIVSRSAVGEYAESVEIRGSGEPAVPGTFRWHILTLKWKLTYSFGGATKNLRARIRHSRHRHDRHKRRLDRRRRKPPRKPQKPGRPPVIIQDPPEPPWSPETFPVPGPDRPLDIGTLIQALNFDADMPEGFARNEIGNGTATRTPNASIAGPGTIGLRLSSGAAGPLSDAAFLSKTIAPSAAGLTTRHAIGVYLRNRFATLPTGGSIRMHEVTDSDLTSIAWLEMSTQVERVRLSIDATPTTQGNASITLDTTSHPLPVNGAPEVQDVAISVAPSAPGSMSIGPAGQNVIVEPGGETDQFILSIGAAAKNGTDLTLVVNGSNYTIPITSGDSRTAIANRIAARTFSGYGAVSSGANVTFTATQPGSRVPPSVNANGNGTAPSIAIITAGFYETREALASRIRGIAYAGWTVSQSPTGAHVVRFTAAIAQPKNPPAISVGTTGATLTATTVTDGFIDSRNGFAASIAARAFPGWTATAALNVVTFTSTTAGVRQKSSYRPGTTGATGAISTVVQGSNGDLTAHARDRDGTVQQRKIISAIAANSIFNTDVSVSGAGTDRAVVTVWASLGGAALEHLARFEDVDLTGLSADVVNLGITSESTPALTWELHCDEGEINNRARTFYRDHTAHGEWAPQAMLYTARDQPVRQDLFLQDARAAVIPGESYTVSMFARADIQAGVPARLLAITGLVSGVKSGATGSTRDLGDVSDSPGITGKTGWTHHKRTITIPGDVFEIVLNSRDIGGAEIVVQEAVVSPGTVPLRTGLYKTTGEYIATFDLRTPRAKQQFKPWGQQRIAFGATVDQPVDSTVMTGVFRSAPTSPDDDTIPDQAVWSPYTSDGASVPDRDFVQAKFTAAGPGNKTPALKAGSPYCEYLLMLGANRRMSTLLTEDRSELPGGVAFAELHEWSERTPDGRRRLPSGRLHDEPSIFPPFGHLPACKIMVFDQATKLHIDENWKDLYVAEVFGQDAITIKLASQPEWARETKSVTESKSGHRQTVWTAQLDASEVVQAVPLPRPGTTELPS